MAVLDSAIRALPVGMELPRGLSAPPAEVDFVTAAEEVLRRYGPRAVTLLTAARQADDGRWVSPRLSVRGAREGGRPAPLFFD